MLSARIEPGPYWFWQEAKLIRGGIRGLFLYGLIVWTTACASSRRQTDEADPSGSSNVPSTSDPASFTGCESEQLVYCMGLAPCCEAAGHPFDIEICESVRGPRHWLQQEPSCEPSAPKALCRRTQADRFLRCSHRRADDPYRTRVLEACAPFGGGERLPGPGENCPDGRCAQSQDTLVTCSEGFDGAPRVCSPPAALANLGEPCSYGCRRHLVCGLDGICAEPLRDGSACEQDGQCGSGVCADGRCDQPSQLGAPECEALSAYSRNAIYVGPAERPLINGRSLYWLTGYRPGRFQLWEGSVDGEQTPRLVADDLHLESSLGRFAMDEHAFYMPHSGLQRLGLESGELTEPTSLTHRVSALAADGEWLWLAEGNCNNLTRVNKDDGEATVVSTDLPTDALLGRTSDALLAVGDAIYCATSSQLFRYRRGQPSVELLTRVTGRTLRAVITAGPHLALIAAIVEDGVWRFELLLLDGDGVERASMPLEDWPASHEYAVDAKREQVYFGVDNGFAVLSLSDGSMRLIEAAPHTQGAPLALSDDSIHWAGGRLPREGSALLHVAR